MGTRTFEIGDLKRMGMEDYVQKYTLNLLQEILSSVMRQLLLEDIL